MVLHDMIMGCGECFSATLIYDAWYDYEEWRRLFCHVMMHDMIVRCGEDYSATLWWMMWLWGVEKTFLPHYNAWYDYEVWRRPFCHIIMHDDDRYNDVKL